MSSSRKGAPGGDHFVELLGDRLSSEPGSRPPHPSGPAPAGPPGFPSARPSHPSSLHHQVTVPPSHAFPPPPAPRLVEDTEPTYAEAAPVSDILPVPHAASGADPFAQFEDPIEGESTRIDAEHLIAEESTRIMQPADERAFFSVVSGKDLGKEYVIGAGETSVGRSIDNDVILTDIAVSRRHLTVHAEPNGQIRLRDLGSGNGSLLNGSRVHEAILQHGDRIEIGETTLVVNLPGGAPLGARGGTTDENAPAPSFPPGPMPGGMLPYPHPPTGAPPFATDYIPAPSATRRLAIPRTYLIAFAVVGGLIVALLGATLTAVVLRSGSGEDEGAALDVTARFNQGTAAYEQGRYAEAERAFAEVISAVGDDEQARLMHERARQAASHQRLIDQARSVLEPDPRAAQRAAVQVPNDSPLHAEAQQVLRDAQRREAAVLLREGQEAVDSGDLATARQRLEEALLIHGEATGAGDLRVAIAEAESSGSRGGRSRRSEPDPPRVAAAPDRGASSRRSAGARGGASSPTPAAARPRGAASRGDAAILAKYRGQDFAGAAQAARQAGESTADSGEARRLERLSRDIEAFGRIFATRSRASASQLSQARALDERISGGHYSGQIAAPLVDAYITAARAALGRNDYATGCRAVREAITVVSGHAEARRMASQCDQRAQQLLGQAQGMERTNPTQAAALYQQVEAMAARGSAAQRTAYQRRNQLRRTAQDEDE